MIDVVNFVAAGLSVAIVLIALKVAFGFVVSGEGRVREVREEGGGVTEKVRGELKGGQRSPSSARAHGLYISVDKDGSIVYGPKSMIAREVL